MDVAMFNYVDLKAIRKYEKRKSRKLIRLCYYSNKINNGWYH